MAAYHSAKVFQDFLPTKICFECQWWVLLLCFGHVPVTHFAFLPSFIWILCLGETRPTQLLLFYHKVSACFRPLIDSWWCLHLEAEQASTITKLQNHHVLPSFNSSIVLFNILYYSENCISATGPLYPICSFLTMQWLCLCLNWNLNWRMHHFCKYSITFKHVQAKSVSAGPRKLFCEKWTSHGKLHLEALVSEFGHGDELLLTKSVNMHLKNTSTYIRKLCKHTYRYQ